MTKIGILSTPSFTFQCMALSKCPAESSVLSIQSSAVSCEWCGAEGLAACTASEGRKSTMGERVRINGGHYIPWCEHQLGDQEIDWANNRLTSVIQGCNWETRKTMARERLRVCPPYLPGTVSL